MVLPLLLVGLGAAIGAKVLFPERTSLLIAAPNGTFRIIPQAFPLGKLQVPPTSTPPSF